MSFRERWKNKNKSEELKTKGVTLRKFWLSIIPFAGNYWIWKYKMPVDYKSYQLICLIVLLITIFV